MFKNYDLYPVYDSEKFDLIKDLQVPLLSNSIDYLRGVGFFSSGWLRLASRGLDKFVENGGKARIIMSPILEENDWEAFEKGEAAKTDKMLYQILFRDIENLAKALENDTRNALAWMISDGLLEFRFAIPRDRTSSGSYHDKVAVFTDQRGDQVAIHGSLNDSIKGSINGEAYSVFKSWDIGQVPYVNMHKTRLEALWEDRNRQFRIYKLPDAIKEKFIQLRKSDNPPYCINSKPDIKDYFRTSKSPIKLHDYQKSAILKWRLLDYRGIFEMATGTGKTITSLAGAELLLNDLGRLVVIILVPFLHLLEQWKTNCLQFGFDPILCSGEHEHSRWQIDVKTSIQDFNIRVKNQLCLLVVHKTAASEKFSKAISRLPWDYTLLIGDEAHGLGSSHLKSALSLKASKRLGLSATPHRWFDEEGTSVLFNYFGPSCFEFTLDEAISRKFLTPYKYFPILTHLSTSELDEYGEFSRKISALFPSSKTDNTIKERIRDLLMRRSRIISSASGKIPTLLELLKKIQKSDSSHGKKTDGILIYCAPGKHKEVLKKVAELGFRCHEFVFDVKLSEREEVLKQFSTGEIQVLVAIKCLDEGVDVPATKIAFFLASSTNPREFVQRRGRVLRLSPGKENAEIFDFLVVPPPNRYLLKLDEDISILKREMPRFVEFSSSASNQFDARNHLTKLLDNYELLDLLDQKPWDVYHSYKQWDWSNND